jgi:hypothetical protein
MFQIKIPLKHWRFFLPIAKKSYKLLKIYKGFVFLIFWTIASKVCFEIYSLGNLRTFRCCVLTNLAGRTKNSVRMVSEVAF